MVLRTEQGHRGIAASNGARKDATIGAKLALLLGPWGHVEILIHVADALVPFLPERPRTRARGPIAREGFGVADALVPFRFRSDALTEVCHFTPRGRGCCCGADAGGGLAGRREGGGLGHRPGGHRPLVVAPRSFLAPSSKATSP